MNLVSKVSLVISGTLVILAGVNVISDAPSMSVGIWLLVGVCASAFGGFICGGNIHKP